MESLWFNSLYSRERKKRRGEKGKGGRKINILNPIKMEIQIIKNDGTELKWDFEGNI